MTPSDGETSSTGLSLRPFRALRPTADGEALAGLLCPPYDVIDPDLKASLLTGDPANIVSVVLPDPTPEGYTRAAEILGEQIARGALAVDPNPALYVYEMTTPDGLVTRGLVGAVELRDPADGVILPHENTMAGPVADRLAVMLATDADLEPIYLIYDGGGRAAQALRDVEDVAPIAHARTPDGITHRLWSITDPKTIDAVEQDLAARRALIADGHHRYATYRERQRQRAATDGRGAWDYGLALLVDSTQYGPQVHAIHRVVPSLTFDHAIEALAGRAGVQLTDDPEGALAAAGGGFKVVITDGTRSALVTDPDGSLAGASVRPGEPAALAELDVTVLHRGVVEGAWALIDDVEHVRYAHSVDEALARAAETDGIAVLLRPTPAHGVAAVAAAGARMPRKSTLFTPKPASGLFMRRLVDQAAGH